MAKEIKEKDNKINELISVVDDLERRLAEGDAQKEEILKIMEESREALNAKNKAVNELSKSINDLQMVNGKLKDLANSRALEIEELRTSFSQSESEMRKNAEKESEKLEQKYMEREKEIKQDMKNLISQLKNSVTDMGKDSEKAFLIYFL